MLAPAQTYCEKWQTCLDQIKSRTTEEEFVKWFKPIVPLEFDGKTLRLCVPNMSYVYQIEKHYIPFLRPIISQLYGQEIRLHYAVPKNDAQSVPVSKEADTTAISQFSTQTNTANIKNPFVIPGLKKIVIDPQLNPNYTFATFIEGECNRLARSAGMAVAVDPGHTPFNPLYIYGNSGLGKTHLLYAIAHQVKRKREDLRIVYIKGDDFTNELIASIREGSNAEFREKYRQAGILLVDDIQFIAGKKQTQEEFFHTFNTLYESGRQIVLTSDRPPREMTQLEDRLQSRFVSGLMVDVAPPDFETRLAIIKNKAAMLGVKLPDEIYGYIAENVTANVRQIEGTLNKLLAYRDLLGDQVDEQSVGRAVRDMLQKSNEYIPSPSVIISYICKYFSVEEDVLRGQRRGRNEVNARQIAMYQIRRMTNLSLKEIGKEFDNRDHTTVLHSIERIEDLVKTDPEKAEIIKDITSNINIRYE